MSALTRPALRYHGGKWKLAPWIVSHFPRHRTYIEPYGGAASVLLRKPRSYAEIYNDLWGEVVNLFRVLRNQQDRARLVEMIELTPFARDEHQLSYTPCNDPVEQARRTVVRSFMGFGSDGLNQTTGFRNNATRSGTTPCHDWANYPPALASIGERLTAVVIENRPAVTLVTSNGLDKPDTLIYADPPYPKSTRDNGDDYAHEMTDDDHREMASVLREIKSMVVVSGYACELYDNELFADWHRVQRATHADGARGRVEVLWIKPNSVVAPTLFCNQ